MAEGPSPVPQEYNMTIDAASAVVLLSGGQDSTTCLFWALANGAKQILALSVQYGQRHDREMQAAKDVVVIARKHYPDATITHEELSVGRVLVGTSPLVSDNDLGRYESVDDLPGGVEPTFVPGRNLLFLILAANRAAAFGARAVVTGLCEEDYGGYFDCRREFVDSMETSIAQGFDGRSAGWSVFTPLMRLDKAATVQMALKLEGCVDALAYTHTCYAGESPPCGECHACHLRARGFREAGIPDPLVVRMSR